MTSSRGFFDLQVPFLVLLGARREHWEPGRSVVSLHLREELTNSWNSAHGGVITALLDAAMGGAAMSADIHETGVVTVNLSVTFVRSATGVLRAEGRALRSGRGLVFCEAEIRNGSGGLVAKGLGTFKVKRRGESGGPNAE
jgi:uncharacterized protein (TIGR00369 family)